VADEEGTVANNNQRELELVVDGFEGDLMAVSEASGLLLEELSLLSFDRLDRLAEGKREAGTRAADPATVGTLVGLFSSPIVLRAAVDIIRSWLIRQKRGSVTITCGQDTLELVDPTRSQQAALIEAFLKKHGGV
jgi:hypothetical protein